MIGFMMMKSRATFASLAAVALTAGAITGIGVLPASAATVSVTIDDMTFTADDGAVSAGASVTGYNGVGGAVVIPASVSIGGTDYAITTIGDSVFESGSVTAITIPSTVTSIGDWAFYGDSLTKLTLPDGLITIGANAFVFNQLTTVTIPPNVTTIGQWAFAYAQLTTVVIGSGVTSIGDYAFYNDFLTELTLPDGLITIGGSAFDSNKFTTVTIPPNVTTIGQSAFAYNQLTTVVIGSGVTSIGRSAFTHNQLKTATIPNSVISVGQEAFMENQLASATIGDSVTTIGECAFCYNKLTTVTIPNSVLSVGPFSFAVNLLTSAIIGNGVTTIGNYAFGGNDSLASLLFQGAAPTIIAAGCFGDATGKTLYYRRAYAAGFASPWNGYTTALNEFATTTAPIIVGSAKVGQTLTAHVGSWLPLPTLSYRWTHSDSAVVLGRNATYVPTAGDVGASLIVTVTGDLSVYESVSEPSAATVAVVPGTFAIAPTPLISGTKQVGRVLSVDAGEWGDDAVLTYAWKWSGTTTVVGTSSRYTSAFTDLGKRLTVTVTATLAGYTTATATSAATTAILIGTFTLAPAPTIAGAITGTVRVAQPLTAVTGTWTTGAAFTYAWKRSGATGAISTDARYVPVTADVGKTLTVTVTATRAGFTTLSKTSVATTAVLGVAFTTSPVPTITGTARSGSVLTAVTTGWEPNTGVTFTYVWKRATIAGTSVAITGATKSTYSLVTADKGKFITVTVIASKTGYASTTKTSAAAGTQIAS